MHKTRVQLAEERGFAEGLKLREIQLGREFILNALQGWFGVIPQDVMDHVNSLNDPIALKSVSFAIGKSETLEQFRDAVGIPLL